MQLTKKVISEFTDSAGPDWYAKSEPELDRLMTEGKTDGKWEPLPNGAWGTQRCFVDQVAAEEWVQLQHNRAKLLDRQIVRIEIVDL
jgi:hypothetical protein